MWQALRPSRWRKYVALSHGPLRRHRRLGYTEALEQRQLLAVVPLVLDTTQAKAFVPTQADYDELGLDWTGSNEPFDDSTWTATASGSPNGVGFDGTSNKYAAYIGHDLESSMRGISPTAYIRIPFTATDVDRIDTLTLNMRFEDGFIAFLNGVEVARHNTSADSFPAWNSTASAGIEASESFTVLDVSSHRGVLSSGTNVLAIRGFNLLAAQTDFLIQATLEATAPDEAIVAADDAREHYVGQPPLVIDVLANDVPGDYPINPATLQIVGQPTHGVVGVNPDTGAITYTPAAGFAGKDTFTYRVRDTSPVPTPNSATQPVTVVSTSGLHQRLIPNASHASLGLTWTGGNEPFNALEWTTAAGGMGYDLILAGTDLTPHIGDNVNAMFETNGSLYARIPFTVIDPPSVVGLRLRMRNDDGFIAYINGVRVAEIRAPQTPAWNSLATSALPVDADALVQQEYFIPMPGISLRPGTGENILAIHGLNTPIDSGDFLIQPELIAEVGTTGVWSNEATVTVNVIGPGPVANDDVASTIGLDSVDIPVLANDQIGGSGAAIRPDTLAIFQQPTYGTATVDPATGQVRYTPLPGFSGDDSFQYTVRDAALVGGTATTTLIPAGAVWSYLDNGTNQGTAWREREFDDSAWATGPAELGYGDGGEATVVSFGPSASNKYVTTYFRRDFDVTSAALVQDLDLRLSFDDGAVVYLNGTEISRVNMPNGTITYTTLANVSGEGQATPPSIATLSGAQLAPLRSGSNTIAVEVHQLNVTNNDMSFNLQLGATVVNPTGYVSNPGTVTVTVIPSNEPPRVVDDVATVKHDRQVVIPVLANDSPGGNLIDATTVEIVAQPAHGSVQVSNDGTISYLPAFHFVGDDSFTYAVRDMAGHLSAAAAVSVSVTNDVPIGVGDEFFVEEDDVLILPAAFGVLRNDSDDSLAPLSATVVEAPSRGQVALSADGAIRYTPNPNFFGQDSFDYRVVDELGATADVAVTIHVIPGPDAPTAISDVYSTTAGVPLLMGAVLPLPTDFAPRGSTWSYLDNGSNQASAWRQFVYNDAAWKSGAAPLGYGNDTEATVVGFGEDPTDRFVTTYFRHAFTVVDAARVYSLALELLRDDGAAVFLNGTEVVRSNLPPDAGYRTPAFVPATGEDETTYFPFVLSPEVLVTGLNLLAVEVHQSHPASADLAFDLRLFGDVAGPITDSVLANDVDLDGEPMTAILASLPAHGTLEFASDGSFIYMPQAGFVGSDSFTYRATDGSGESNLATVTIDILPAASFSADLNEDGRVDAADVAIVAAGLGMVGGAHKALGDVNGDGRVNLHDLLEVQRSQGSTVQSVPSAPAAVIVRRLSAARDLAILATAPERLAIPLAARRATLRANRANSAPAVDSVFARETAMRSKLRASDSLRLSVRPAVRS